MTEYGFSRKVNLPFEATLEKVTDELKKEGFGVLTSIDVKDTMKKKLDIDFKKYTILGACNPPIAHKALSEEEELGLLLPCNIIVYEKEDSTRVSFFDPELMTKIVANEKLKPIASEVKQKLLKVADALSDN
ncbi:MAG: DUF302 domain-containing protein [Ignavibacteriaceae bacterium]